MLFVITAEKHAYNLLTPS